MTHDEAIQKAVKLLRLATSSNPNEAALAASRAQEIIDRYKIEAAALDLCVGGRPAEPIKDFGLDPIDQGAKQVATWAWRLCLVICKANGVKPYVSPLGGIALVGRPSNVATVRYFYAWLKAEVSRLAERDCKGNGRTWANNYRNGVVDTISERLREQHRETINKVTRELLAETTAQTQTMALVRIQNAVAKVEAEREEVDAWAKENLTLRKTGGSSTCYNPTARDAGRRAGREIRLQPAKAQLQ